MEREMLKENLTNTVESWEKLGHPAILERFVLRNGRAFKPRDRIGRRKKASLCFMNAAHFVFANLSKGAKYVEGYAMDKKIGWPIHHAWVTLDGKTAMDPTLNAEHYDYYGVEIDTDMLRKELLRNKVYGVLDTGYGMNTEFMFKVDPELETIVKNVKGDAKLMKMMEANR